MACFFTQLLSEPLPPPIARLLANSDQVKPRPRISRRLLPFTAQDNPSASFYRMYEYLIAGKTMPLRNEFEYFCVKHPDWAIVDLPDPADTRDPARYAVLAAMTHLLCEAFNRRVELGLPRDAPPIVEDWEELARRPKVLERVPAWADKVEPLVRVLRVPDPEGNYVEADDPEVCRPFKRLNILIPQPHIHFV
jgi:hypothetical protein